MASLEGSWLTSRADAAVPAPPAAPVLQDAVQQPPASAPPVQQPVPSSGGSYGAPPGSFEACVIRVESGGDAQIMNASGHYGLFQFAYSTWIGGGGASGLFGHASPAYQVQIFDNVYAADGTSPWAPYDGC